MDYLSGGQLKIETHKLSGDTKWEKGQIGTLPTKLLYSSNLLEARCIKRRQFLSMRLIDCWLRQHSSFSRLPNPAVICLILNLSCVAEQIFF